MKTTKVSKTTTKSRIIFFAIVLTYNVLLGLYLKDFFVLPPIFTTFLLAISITDLVFRPENTVNTYAGNRTNCPVFSHDNAYS